MKPSSKLIAKILTLCGISLTCTACYGIPEGPYKEDIIEGRIVAKGSGRPIEGIKVSYATRNTDIPASEENYLRSMTYSDKDGKYVLYPLATGEILVIAEDDDGEKNGGEFATKTRVIELEMSDYAGGKGLTPGTTTKTVDFTLEFKSEENENE